MTADDTAPIDAQPAPVGDAWRRALDYGIDLSQTGYLLTLTPAQRFERHEQTLTRVRALRQAGIKHYGFDPRYPETAE